MVWLANTTLTAFFVPLAEGDTVDKVKGIYVRPYPTTSQPDMVRPVGTDKFPGRRHEAWV